MADGLSHPLLLHVASALRESLDFIQPHHLSGSWSYSYPSGANEGMAFHNEKGAVSVNLWATPLEDESAEGEEEDHGGMTVWLRHTSLKMLGQKLELAQINAHLDGAETRVVGYKYNRAVIFDGDFYHASNPKNIHSGHTNRRINLTWLFGGPQAQLDSCPSRLSKASA